MEDSLLTVTGERASPVALAGVRASRSRVFGGAMQPCRCPGLAMRWLE